MLQDYRRAIAGALVTLAVAALGAFDVGVPAEAAAAAVTLVVFALGFVPARYVPEAPPEEPEA